MISLEVATACTRFLLKFLKDLGVVDVSNILGSANKNAYLLDVQSHNPLGGELVEGGQLMVMYQDITNSKS